MTTLGTPPFEVISPDLTDPADITVAFKDFYEGAGAVSGVEDHLASLNGRLTTLELNPPNVEFLSNTFRIKDNGDNTKKVAFGLSGVTTNTTATLTVTTSGEIVLKDATQTLQNKTLNTTNTIQSDATKFSLARLSGGSVAGEVKFDLASSITGTKTISVPDPGSGDSIVLANTIQNLLGKSFGGYKELSTTVNALGTANNVPVSAYNLVYASPNTTPTTNSQMIVNLQGMQNGVSVFIIVKGVTATYTITPVIYIDGVAPTIRWAGGVTPSAIAANATARHALISITRLGDTNFGTYLGEYY